MDAELATSQEMRTINTVELPAWLITLARLVAREARQPGHYVLHIVIPPHKADKVKFTLALQQTLKQG